MTTISVATYLPGALPQAEWSCKTHGPLARYSRHLLVAWVVPCLLVCDCPLPTRINKGRVRSGSVSLTVSLRLSGPLPSVVSSSSRRSGSFLASMVSFPANSIQEIRLHGLEKKGFIPSKDVSGWRPENKGDVGRRADDEVVVLASFYEPRFGLPLHPFVRGLLHYYQLELQNLNPNVVLHIACFIMLCEAFMGIKLHWGLWQYLFSVRVYLDHDDLPYVGSAIIQLRTGRKKEYLQVPLPSSVRYEGEWFYACNIARSAPQFTGRELILAEQRHSKTDMVHKGEVDRLLVAIVMLKQRGISGAWLVCVFMHRRI
jgi:hypothetical protein